MIIVNALQDSAVHRTGMHMGGALDSDTQSESMDLDRRRRRHRRR